MKDHGSYDDFITDRMIGRELSPEQHTLHLSNSGCEIHRLSGWRQPEQILDLVLDVGRTERLGFVKRGDLTLCVGLGEDVLHDQSSDRQLLLRGGRYQSDITRARSLMHNVAGDEPSKNICMPDIVRLLDQPRQEAASTILVNTLVETYADVGVIKQHLGLVGEAGGKKIGNSDEDNGNDAGSLDSATLVSILISHASSGRSMTAVPRDKTLTFTHRAGSPRAWMVMSRDARAAVERELGRQLDCDFTFDCTGIQDGRPWLDLAWLESKRLGEGVDVFWQKAGQAVTLKPGSIYQFRDSAYAVLEMSSGIPEHTEGCDPVAAAAAAASVELEAPNDPELDGDMVTDIDHPGHSDHLDNSEPQDLTCKSLTDFDAFIEDTCDAILVENRIDEPSEPSSIISEMPPSPPASIQTPVFETPKAKLKPVKSGAMALRLIKPPPTPTPTPPRTRKNRARVRAGDVAEGETRSVYAPCDLPDVCQEDTRPYEGNELGEAENGQVGQDATELLRDRFRRMGVDGILHRGSFQLGQERLAMLRPEQQINDMIVLWLLRALESGCPRNAEVVDCLGSPKIDLGDGPADLLVLLPIFDPGMRHFTLLVLDMLENTAVYYDDYSMSEAARKQIADRCGSWVLEPGSPLAWEERRLTADGALNGYDCGVWAVWHGAKALGRPLHATTAIQARLEMMEMLYETSDEVRVARLKHRCSLDPEQGLEGAVRDCEMRLVGSILPARRGGDGRDGDEREPSTAFLASSERRQRLQSVIDQIADDDTFCKLAIARFKLRTDRQQPPETADSDLMTVVLEGRLRRTARREAADIFDARYEALAVRDKYTALKKKAQLSLARERAQRRKGGKGKAEPQQATRSGPQVEGKVWHSLLEHTPKALIHQCGSSDPNMTEVARMLGLVSDVKHAGRMEELSRDVGVSPYLLPFGTPCGQIGDLDNTQFTELKKMLQEQRGDHFTDDVRQRAACLVDVSKPLRFDVLSLQRRAGEALTEMEGCERLMWLLAPVDEPFPERQGVSDATVARAA